MLLGVLAFRKENSAEMVFKVLVQILFRTDSYLLKTFIIICQSLNWILGFVVVLVEGVLIQNIRVLHLIRYFHVIKCLYNFSDSIFFSIVVFELLTDVIKQQ